LETVDCNWNQTDTACKLSLLGLRLPSLAHTLK
jgi:hypothetical protein